MTVRTLYDPVSQPYGYDDAAGAAEAYGAPARPYSAPAEAVLLAVLTFLTVEGIFRRYLEQVVVQRSAFWARLTPFNLFPSELLLYGPVLLLGCCWLLAGRRFGYRTARGLGLVVVFVGIGFVQAVHGKFAGSVLNIWLADFRQLFLMAIFAPLFAVIGNGARLWKVAERFVAVAVPLAAVNGALGAAALTGLVEREGPLEPYFSGDVLLVLAYVLAVVRGVSLGRVRVVPVAVLALGILMPLAKPGIAMFVFANVLLVLGMQVYRRPGRPGLSDSVRVLVLVVLALGTFAVVAEMVAGDAARTWLAERFLKTHLAESKRDLSTGRFAAWAWGMEQFMKNPVFGTGLGFHQPIRTDAGELRYINMHNLTVTLIYQTGAVCFVILATLAVVWLRRTHAYVRSIEDVQEYWPALGLFVWVCAVLLTAHATQALGVPNLGGAFWICVGLLAAREAQHRIRRYHEWQAAEHYDAYAAV